ncbi:MAG: hypothetical protein IT290_10500 [Deltaproteobacteria bacterium]|nr:hypothetical protein [Deltaproteobacteria bacterium]
MFHRVVLVLFLVIFGVRVEAQGKGASFARSGQDVFTVTLGRSGAINFSEIRRGKSARGAIAKARSISAVQRLRGAMLAPMTKSLLSRGTPYVFYVDAKSRALSVAIRKSGKWLIEKIDRVKRVANQFSVTPCGSKVCASFYDTASGQVFIAEGSSKRWSVSPVPSSGRGVVTSIGRSARGDIAVMQHAPESGEVSLALRSAGRWINEETPVSERSPVFQSSLRFDKSGTLYAAVNVGSGLETPRYGTVYLLIREPDGSWRAGRVSQGFVGNEAAIALTNGGRPVLSFQRTLRQNGAVTRWSEFAELATNGVWHRLRYPSSAASGTITLTASADRVVLSTNGPDLVTLTLQQIGASLVPIKEVEVPIQ